MKLLERLIARLERIPHSNGGRQYDRPLRTWSAADGDLTLVLLFEPRDLWRGWYWDVAIEGEFVQWAVWVEKGVPSAPCWGYRSRHCNCRVYTLYWALLPTLVFRLRWKDRRAVKADVAAKPNARYLNYRQGIAFARALEADAIARDEERRLAYADRRAGRA